MEASPDPAPPAPRLVRRYALAVAVVLAGPLVALGMPDTVQIPMLQERGPGDPPDAAIFSHWAHDMYSCASCHPGTFPQYRLGFTHKDMEAGRFCGSCHDGQTAFGPKDRGVQCETCHVPRTQREEIDEDDLWKD